MALLRLAFWLVVSFKAVAIGKQKNVQD